MEEKKVYQTILYVLGLAKLCLIRDRTDLDISIDNLVGFIQTCRPLRLLCDTTITYVV